MTVRPARVSSGAHRRARWITKVVTVLALALTTSPITMTGSSTAGEGPPTSDSGTIAPGESLSTVTGPPNNPVSPSDPFALSLTNVSDETFDASITEEPCDGSQEGDPLCSKPRLGGVAGNFQFSPSGGGSEALILAAAPRPVTVGRLFYDATLVAQAEGVRIFYQKNIGGPVLRLRRCGDDGRRRTDDGGRRTECFTLKKLRSGDQVVKVPFKDDPRVTRG